MTSEAAIAGIPSEDSTFLQYESLRSKALNKQAAICQRSLGLALFIRQGMLAWIEACHRCIRTNSVADKQRDRPMLAYETTSEMIKVMANITMFNLEEAASCHNG